MSAGFCDHRWRRLGVCCGGTSMGTAVMEAVKDALELRLKDRAQAEKYV